VREPEESVESPWTKVYGVSFTALRGRWTRSDAHNPGATGSLVLDRHGCASLRPRQRSVLEVSVVQRSHHVLRIVIMVMSFLLVSATTDLRSVAIGDDPVPRELKIDPLSRSNFPVDESRAIAEIRRRKDVRSGLLHWNQFTAGDSNS